jgi:hypothetical protein
MENGVGSGLMEDRVDPVYPTLLQSKRIRLRFAPDVDGERRSEKVGT